MESNIDDDQSVHWMNTFFTQFDCPGQDTADENFQNSEERLKLAFEHRRQVDSRLWSLNNRLENDKRNTTFHIQLRNWNSAFDEERNIRVVTVPGQQQMVVWDCALVLCRYLELIPQLVRDRRVIELGCGVGLPGLFSSALGASFVLLTEKAHAVSFIQRHIDNNIFVCCNVKAAALEWTRDRTIVNTQEHLDKPFDVILCSDLIYAGDSETTTNLAHTIQTLTIGQKDAVVISAFEIRHVGVYSKSGNSSESQNELFTHLLADLANFNIVNTVPLDSMDEEFRDEFIKIMIYRRK